MIFSGWKQVCTGSQMQREHYLFGTITDGYVAG